MSYSVSFLRFARNFIGYRGLNAFNFLRRIVLKGSCIGLPARWEILLQRIFYRFHILFDVTI